MLEELEQLKAWARSSSVRSLATSALCNQIIVIAEYQRELPKADALASAGMDEFGDMPQSKFSIADTIARQHHYFGNAADAVRWFDTAVAVHEVSPAPRVRSLTLAGVAAHRFNVDLARRYLEQGVAAAESNGVSPLLRVTVRGELGILQWNAGQTREAYELWSTAAQELLTAQQDTKGWKTLFRLFGNCTGHFLGGMRGFAIGEAEVIVPFSGILLREIADIDQLHKPELDWLLPVQMALLAESVGAYEQSVEWATRSKVGAGDFRVGAGAPRRYSASRDLAEHRYKEIICVAADLGDLDENRDTGGFAHPDEEVRTQLAARFTARLNLIAVAIELARIGLHNRLAIEAHAHTAAELSRECAARYGGSFCGLA